MGGLEQSPEGVRLTPLLPLTSSHTGDVNTQSHAKGVSAGRAHVDTDIHHAYAHCTQTERAPVKGDTQSLRLTSMVLSREPTLFLRPRFPAPHQEESG